MLSGESQHKAQTAGVRHRAETVVKITRARRILLFHVLALYDKPDLAALKAPFFHFEMKAGGENVIISSKGGPFHSLPNFAFDEAIHFRLFGKKPKRLEGVIHGNATMFWIGCGARVAMGPRFW